MADSFFLKIDSKEGISIDARITTNKFNSLSKATLPSVLRFISNKYISPATDETTRINRNSASFGLNLLSMFNLELIFRPIQYRYRVRIIELKNKVGIRIAIVFDKKKVEP